MEEIREYLDDTSKEFIVVDMGIHITHIDMDAVGCVVLDKILNKDKITKTEFCANGNSTNVLKNRLLEFLSEGTIPSRILITDIDITEDMASILDELIERFNIEVLGFDHHITNKLGENHKWFTIMPDFYYDETIDADVKISATMVYYIYIMVNHEDEFLNNIYPNRAKFGVPFNVSTFVNDVSRYDTWEWKEHPDASRKLSYRENIGATLCAFYGVEKLTNILINNFNTEAKIFWTEHMIDIYHTIMEKQEKYEANIDNVTKEVEVYFPPTSITKVPIFIGCSDMNDSAAMNLLLTNNPSYPFGIILYPSTKTLSFRTTNDDVDVSAIASNLGGGGHKKAAGAQFNSEDF